MGLGSVGLGGGCGLGSVGLGALGCSIQIWTFDLDGLADLRHNTSSSH